MNKPIAILIDDEPDIRELLAISLARMGFECHQAASFREGENLIKATRCDLCLTDVRMPDGSGIDLVRLFKSLYPTAPIAVMTAYDTTEIAVQALKAGAFDFLAKPIRAQRLEALISDARLMLTAKQAPTTENTSDALVGEATIIKTLRDNLSKASNSMAPVLIEGEPGTGKELVARSIHQQSQRSQGPFIAVDCGAIPHDVLDSAFFGQGTEQPSEASSNSTGFFQAASGGSLFLSELSELPIYFQVKLLRALKEHIVTPSGSSALIPIDVRLLCATHNDLESAVLSGSFREDLYYHLNVINLQTPPLRDHPEDIELLSVHLLKKYVANQPIQFDAHALTALQQHTYPGNVRELENVLYRAATTCSDNVICLEDLNFPESPASSDMSNLSNAAVNPLEISDLEGYLSDLENEIITAVLHAEKWNRTKAAKRLGLTTRQFRYKMAKYHPKEDS